LPIDSLTRSVTVRARARAEVRRFFIYFIRRSRARTRIALRARARARTEHELRRQRRRAGAPIADCETPQKNITGVMHYAAASIFARANISYITAAFSWAS